MKFKQPLYMKSTRYRLYTLVYYVGCRLQKWASTKIVNMQVAFHKDHVYEPDPIDDK